MKFKIGDVVGCDKHSIEMEVVGVKSKEIACKRVKDAIEYQIEVHNSISLYKIIRNVEELDEFKNVPLV